MRSLLLLSLLASSGAILCTYHDVQVGYFKWSFALQPRLRDPCTTVEIKEEPLESDGTQVNARDSEISALRCVLRAPRGSW